MKVVKGFILKKHWADLILNGNKTWEIRGSNCKIRGKVGIISGGKWIGNIDIVDCIEINLKMYRENIDKHNVGLEEDSKFGSVLKLPYKKTFAWILASPKKFLIPKNYIHKKGCVIWVNL